ncbi:hypothetical protein E1162_18645 [Rhodobacteraceae bacterium RKSG542]|uniref:hypothetical protein n=1 Tax=Pseudovibrio flavus TaxID=2529854 RepID=UPI0012BC1AEC|nr:hypothetical protein [Pseudovibrio flavus]MTI19265.1 hypothetical protein [Pseudovibrio flavus]
MSNDTNKSAVEELEFDQNAITTAAQAMQFCQRFETALTNLVTVINEETDILKRGELKSLSVVAPKKSAAIHTYMHGVRLAQKNAIALGNLAPQAVAQMREQHSTIRPILQKNLSVVATARSVTDTVVETVAKAVGSSMQTKTYSAGGMQNQPQKGARGIAINRQL